MVSGSCCNTSITPLIYHINYRSDSALTSDGIFVFKLQIRRDNAASKCYSYIDNLHHPGGGGLSRCVIDPISSCRPIPSPRRPDLPQQQNPFLPPCEGRRQCRPRHTSSTPSSTVTSTLSSSWLAPFRSSPRCAPFSAAVTQGRDFISHAGRAGGGAAAVAARPSI